jgi:peptide/nickel transport system substrate-binding protein
MGNQILRLSRRRALIAGAALAAFAFTSAPAAAQDNACRIVFAHGAAVTSIDPHFHALTPNGAVAEHIFSKMVLQDENLRVQPGLAKSWEVSAEDPKVWTFHLRDDVKWHDGTPFTADDIVYTFERVPNVPNSPSNYSLYTQHVAKIDVIDDHTIQFTTKDVFPLMPQYAALLTIISRNASEGRSTQDFNDGIAAIGTGPYKYKEYVPGEKIVLTRNEDYWGDKPQVKEVEFRFISNNATRVAALLAGDVDVIDTVPTIDADSLAARDGIRVVSTAGVRNIFISIDQGREASPFVFDNAGKPLEKNPLLDQKVRQALSMAINRSAIVKAVMNGQAAPSGQLLPKGVMGHVEELTPLEYDAEGARKLLAEAGYPEGFQITLHGPNDRYINDAEVVQAVAQMWTRIGVKTTVDTMPSSVYFTRSGKDEFSAGLLGWGTGSGEPDSPMVGVLASKDASRGRGTANRSLYSSPEFDALLDKALASVDIDEREGFYRDATRVAINDVSIIPLHHQYNIWAMRDGLNIIPQVDEQSLARNVSFENADCK